MSAPRWARYGLAANTSCASLFRSSVFQTQRRRGSMGKPEADGNKDGERNIREGDAVPRAEDGEEDLSEAGAVQARAVARDRTRLALTTAARRSLAFSGGEASTPAAVRIGAHQRHHRGSPGASQRRGPGSLSSSSGAASGCAGVRGDPGRGRGEARHVSRARRPGGAALLVLRRRSASARHAIRGCAWGAASWWHFSMLIAGRERIGWRGYTLLWARERRRLRRRGPAIPGSARPR